MIVRFCSIVFLRCVFVTLADDGARALKHLLAHGGGVVGEKHVAIVACERCQEAAAISAQPKSLLSMKQIERDGEDIQ